MADSAGTILLVEDERNIADTLADYLRQSGFKTSHLVNGSEVAAFVKKTHQIRWLSANHLAPEKWWLV